MEAEFKKQTKIGDEESNPKQWQWMLQGVFFIPAMLLTLLGTLLFRIANVLMFDTHHFEVIVKPKK